MTVKARSVRNRAPLVLGVFVSLVIAVALMPLFKPVHLWGLARTPRRSARSPSRYVDID